MKAKQPANKAVQRVSDLLSHQPQHKVQVQDESERNSSTEDAVSTKKKKSCHSKKKAKSVNKKTVKKANSISRPKSQTTGVLKAPRSVENRPPAPRKPTWLQNTPNQESSLQAMSRGLQSHDQCVMPQEHIRPMNNAGASNEMEQLNANTSPDDAEMPLQQQENVDESLILTPHRPTSPSDNTVADYEVTQLNVENLCDQFKQVHSQLQLENCPSRHDLSMPSELVSPSDNGPTVPSKELEQSNKEQHLTVKTFYGRSSRGRNLRRSERQYSAPPSIMIKRCKHQ